MRKMASIKTKIIHENAKKILAGFIALNLIIFSPVIFSMPPLQLFKSHMGDEKWKVNGNRLRCGLSLGIPGFGIAYFEQNATQPPHFILNKWQQIMSARNVTIQAIAPPWKPDNHNLLTFHATMKPTPYTLFLNEKRALTLLGSLNTGYDTRFKYQGDDGILTFIILSPIHFKHSYNKYVQCVGNLIAFTYDDVKKTILHFSKDDTELTDQDKQALDKVVEYYRADRSIKAIKIVGYTDDTGRKSYNNAISEHRAKQVARYLAFKGIHQAVLRVTWFGLKFPLYLNNSEEGRALNRRVEVLMLKTPLLSEHHVQRANRLQHPKLLKAATNE